MELILIAVGVIIFLFSGFLVFFVYFKTMKESSYEEAAMIEKLKRQQVEEALGIKNKEQKKEKKKKSKRGKIYEREMEEIELTMESSEDADDLKSGDGDTTEPTNTDKNQKKKNQKNFEKNEDKVVGARLPEKMDSKKSGKAALPGGKSTNPAASAEEQKVKSVKSKRLGENLLIDKEDESPFIVAESKSKKKKQSLETAVSSTKPVSRETAVTSAKSSLTTKIEEQSGIVLSSKTTSSVSKTNSSKVQELGARNFPVKRLVDEMPELEASQWTKKGDPYSSHKNQVEDKDIELRDLRLQLLTANARYDESRQDLVTLGQSFAMLENKLQDQITEKVKEVEAMKSHMSRTHLEHVSEINQLNQQLRTFKGQGPGSDGQMKLIIILTEENKKLKDEVAATKTKLASSATSGSEDLQQKVKFMDEALKQNAIFLNASENAKKTLEVKLKQMEAKMNKHEAQLKEAETAKAKQLSLIAEDLEESKSENRSLVRKLEAFKKEVAELQEQQLKFKNEEQKTNDLEGQVKSLASQFTMCEQLIKQKDIELEDLRNKNTELSEDLKKSHDANNKAMQDVEELKERLGEKGKSEDDFNSQSEKIKDELKTSKSNNANLEIQLSEGKVLQNKLQTELDHYKTVLADTEKLLTAIQKKVETEETNWSKKLASVEEKLRSSQDEAKELRQELEKQKNFQSLENGTVTAEDLSQDKSDSLQVIDSPETVSAS